MSFDAVAVSVRSFRNPGRAAVTTMRAAPDCSSGTLCLPSERETWSPSGPTRVTVAVCAPSSV
jgi:hypothetical protein